MIIKRRMKSYQNHNKDLKMKHVVHILKKSIRLQWVVMMIKDHALLIELGHIHMEQMLLKYVKIRC